MTSSVKIGGWRQINDIMAKRLGIALSEDERFNDILDQFAIEFPDARIVVTTNSASPLYPTETLYAAFDTIEAAAEFKLRYV